MSDEEKIPTICALWGDEWHFLNPSPEEWAAIKAGGEVVIEGGGYHYEGEEFIDTWSFDGGIGGEFAVTYAEKGDDTGASEAQGYEGTLTEEDLQWEGD